MGNSVTVIDMLYIIIDIDNSVIDWIYCNYFLKDITLDTILVIVS